MKVLIEYHTNPIWFHNHRFLLHCKEVFPAEFEAIVRDIIGQTYEMFGARGSRWECWKNRNCDTWGISFGEQSDAIMFKLRFGGSI